MKPSLFLSSSTLLLVLMANHPGAFAAPSTPAGVPTPNALIAAKANAKPLPSVAAKAAAAAAHTTPLGPFAGREIHGETAAGRMPSATTPAARARDAQKKFVKQMKSTSESLHERSFFGESNPSLAGGKLPGAPETHAAALRGTGHMFFSGKTGALTAARFVGRHARTDGDFRYAYTRPEFLGFMRGVQVLEEIPVGKFADRLSVNMLRELNKLTFVEQPGIATKLGAKAQSLWNGRHTPPGETRQTEWLTITDPSDHEIRQLERDGFRFKVVEKWQKPGKRDGLVRLIDPKDVPAALEKLVTDTQQELRDPTSDPTRTAARFLRRFIAIHPFTDGNGRIARLMVDRILHERGIAPPILADDGRDLTVSEDDVMKNIRDGVDRMNKSVQESSIMADKPTTVQQMMQRSHSNWRVTTASAKPIYIGGIPFAQSADGFVYDHAGRPYMTGSDGKLQPMSRLTHYLAVKRMSLAADGPARLAAFTAATRETFAKLEGFESLGRGFAPDDTAAIKSDSEYRIQLPRTGNEAFVRLFDPATIPADRLFGRPETYGYAATSVTTFAISRYQQLDLEMWHAERGLKDSGDKAGAKQMRDYRRQLFSSAKSYLAGLPKKGTVTADNPEGFEFTYEKMALQRSPLSHGSFDDYAKKNDDDKIWLWHGDTIVGRWAGIHGSNSPVGKSARQLAKVRAEKDGARDFTAEFEKIEGNNDGSGYKAFTTDIGLLSQQGGFGDGSRSASVDLGAMKPLQLRVVDHVVPAGKTIVARTDGELLHALLGREPTRVPEGHIDVTGFPADVVSNFSYNYDSGVADRIRAALEAPAKTPPGPIAKLLRLKSDDRVLVDLRGVATPEQLDSIRKSVDARRTLVTITRDAANPNQLSVQMRTRTYGTLVPKKDAMPGIQAQGNATFISEQEVHVIDHVWPNQIKTANVRGELVRPLGPSQAKADATP